MAIKMASIAVLCLLLLEHFLAADIDDFTEPVLRGLRVLEESAVNYAQSVIPSDLLSKEKNITQFYLFTPETGAYGVRLTKGDTSGFLYFHADRETKMIIHGFLDKVSIADWMHDMKNEFLLFDDVNVIIVDWSMGNFIPYSQAAANTERVGEEISNMMFLMMETYGAKPRKFHLIGHSLGSHVAGYVGERIKGIRRITALDPAAHMFSNASPRKKIDRSDAEFVDVIHTDAGGIGMVKPVGHVDFYPNGGEVQPGCTASNSLRSLLEKGVIEGVRNIICSHMRAPLLFTDTINGRHCEMTSYECSNNEDFMNGECESCGEFNSKCAIMGFHVDTRRNYGNRTKFYLQTAKTSPYCGYEYKLTLDRVTVENKTWRNTFPLVLRHSEWSSSDILHISIYGHSGFAEFTIERRGKRGFQPTYLVFSPVDLGSIHGAIVRWSKKPLTKARGIAHMVSTVIGKETKPPVVHRIEVKPMKTPFPWENAPTVFQLCINPSLTAEQVQTAATFRNVYC